MTDHLISVVMPAYNEGHHIRRNLEETIRLFERARCRFEIIAVDDGSIDDTRSEILAVRARDERVVLVAHDRNRGKGFALRAGCEIARGDFTVFLDSDLDLHPRQIAGLFRRMRDARADVVVGSKWHARSRIRYPLQRKVISQIYRTILWVFFDLPLRDTQTGLKIFRSEALARAFPRLLCKRYALDVELLANIHRLGYRIIEAPVVLEFRRRHGFGRITYRDLVRTGVDTLAIFYRMYLRRYYDAPPQAAPEGLPLIAREISDSGR
ncbi:MAG: glycosyltransferase [Planctomycetes bacterium]|nr:glycosyltransferase [Planctomycetota bacterium]